MKYSMHKVIVSQPSNPRSKPAVWATFALATDAHRFAELVRAENTTWHVEIKYPS